MSAFKLEDFSVTADTSYGNHMTIYLVRATHPQYPGVTGIARVPEDAITDLIRQVPDLRNPPLRTTR